MGLLQSPLLLCLGTSEPAASTRFPMQHLQACRFSGGMAHSAHMSWPGWRAAGPRKGPNGPCRPQGSCSHVHSWSAMSPGVMLVLKDFSEAVLGLLSPLSEEQTFQKTIFSFRCGGAMTIGLPTANTVLASVCAFWPSFFCFVVVLDVIFLWCILFSICGKAFTLTVQLPWKTDCLISTTTSKEMRIKSDSNFKGKKMWFKWCKKLILYIKASLNS